MKYLQFFVDKAKYLEPYQDDERGRLLMAMIAYASDGTEPHFDGNERYIWPVFRQMIDASSKSLENKRKGGSASQSKEDDAQADVSTAEPKGTDDSSAEQTSTEPDTHEQNGTEPDNIQESRIKNQESGTKREGGKAASAPRERFAPPSPAEVSAYADQIGASHVDGERFCDFYASKGWRVGSQPMRDWRAAVRTWAKRDSGGHPPDKPGKTVREQQYSQRTYGQEADKALDAMMAEYTARQGGGGT